MKINSFISQMQSFKHNSIPVIGSLKQVRFAGEFHFSTIKCITTTDYKNIVTQKLKFLPDFFPLLFGNCEINSISNLKRLYLMNSKIDNFDETPHSKQTKFLYGISHFFHTQQDAGNITHKIHRLRLGSVRLNRFVSQN